MPSKPKRKTFDVADFRIRINHSLRLPDEALNVAGMTPAQAFRLGRALALESVLHATNNYGGYQYLGPYVAGKTDTTRREYV